MTADAAAPAAAAPRRGPGIRRSLAARRLTLRAWLGAVLVGAFVVAAAAAPYLAPALPDAQDIAHRLAPPSYGGAFFLGSDRLGRDLASRILYGARISLVVSALATAIAVASGTALGTAAGFYGGAVDRVLMRIVDAQMAFPYLLLAIAFMLVVPPSIPNIALVLGVTGWVVYARVMRVAVLALREREFVLAATAVGARERRVLLRHIVPNLIPTVVVLATTQVAQFILAEAALSFLGLGLPPNVPSWGNLVNDGREYLDSAWWIEVFPGLAIVVATAGVGLLGDWLRDVLDPHLRT